MNRMVILNFILVYTLYFRFWPTVVFIFCYFATFPFVLPSSSDYSAISCPEASLPSCFLSLLSVSVFSAVFGIESVGGGRTETTEIVHVWLMSEVVYFHTFFPIKMLVVQGRFFFLFLLTQGS